MRTSHIEAPFRPAARRGVSAERRKFPMALLPCCELLPVLCCDMCVWMINMTIPPQWLLFCRSAVFYQMSISSPTVFCLNLTWWDFPASMSAKATQLLNKLHQCRREPKDMSNQLGTCKGQIGEPIWSQKDRRVHLVPRVTKIAVLHVSFAYFSRLIFLCWEN